MTMTLPSVRRARGFTLVELILVMVIVGVIAGVLAMQLGPAFQSYAAVARRASLTHQADTALRRIVAEVRTAVPNSLRLTTTAAGASPAQTCLEMVPTSDGGRFRIAADPGIAGSNPLDLSQPVSSFEVLTDFTVQPAVGDSVVIGNQNTNDVYTGASRGKLASAPQVAPPATPAGYPNPPYRAILQLSQATQFPYGYEGGRFAIVPDRDQAVSYVCSGAGTDATGTGTGTLQRYSHYGFLPTQSCAPASGAGGVTVATKVSNCNVVYNPTQGVTQQSGYVALQLTLSDSGESVTLSVGSQVENVP